MPNEAALVDALRNVRGNDDAISRLTAESLEARRDRIAEALGKSDWAGGPAELIATYPHHALASKNGVLMRVRVTEDEAGKFVFDKIEVYQIPTPVADVGREVMETARVAVDRILEGKFEEAAPMVATIANAVYTSGDLKTKIMTEIAKRSINREAWWHKVVAEHLERLGQIEEFKLDRPTDESGLAIAIESLRDRLVERAKAAATAIKKLAESGSVPDSIESAARDISTDLKYAIQALTGANKDDPAEMSGVYEGVGAVAEQLALGSRFLESLAGLHKPEKKDGDRVRQG